MFTCKTHVQMKPASCFRLAPCFCLSRLCASRCQCQHLAACENLRHIYIYINFGRAKICDAPMLCAWKIAQSQILRPLRLNYYTIFIFCACTFKICVPDTVFEFCVSARPLRKSCATEISVARYKLSSLVGNHKPYKLDTLSRV